jgi:hypothetical protein
MKISEKAHSWVLDEIKDTGRLFFTGWLILLLVYIQQIPQSVSTFFQTSYGGLVGILLVFGILHQFGWPQGILAGLALVLFLSDYTQPIKGREGFTSKEQFHDVPPAFYSSGSSQKVFLPDKHRWFVERVTGESPLLIEENVVKTQAVEDDSTKGTGSVQNSSVQSM